MTKHGGRHPKLHGRFFRTSGTGDGWTKDEREWRIVDHLQLSELPVAAVVVFVDTEAAADSVQRQTGGRSLWCRSNDSA